jgi:hypothetical protein
MSLHGLLQSEINGLPVIPEDIGLNISGIQVQGIQLLEPEPQWYKKILEWMGSAGTKNGGDNHGPGF